MPPRIAVELQADQVSPGEFLADVQAYEAAGAHSVWLSTEALEPLTLLAAAAVVTARVRLVASLPGAGTWPPDLLARVVATLRHLSRDRVAFAVGRGAPAADPAPERATGLVEHLDVAPAALERARAGGAGPDFELWARVPAPGGRAAWREALAAAEAVGATGVVVPHAANLLDILRNPEEDDRQDLAIATG